MTDVVGADFGSSLFRIQSGEGTRADVLGVLDAIVESESVRARCGALGTLVADASRKEREDNCARMIETFFSLYHPDAIRAEPAPGKLDLAHVARLALLKSLPCPGSPWAHEHLEVVRSGNKQQTAAAATLSLALAEVIWALEDLWAVPGTFVMREPISMQF